MRGLTSLIAPSSCSRLSPVFFARSYCTATPKNAGKKYEASLLLPKTTLPMYHSPAKEKELIHDPSALYKWQEQNNEKTGKTWITHDGPPYANGDLHLGHVFNKTLKDFVNRYKLLQGHKVSYVPGWDCHGLPIELKAMEKLRKKEKEAAQHLSAVDIRKHARQFATAEVQNQMRDFMSLGVMAEWDNPYITMESQYCATQLEVFYSLYTRGFVFRGSKPVHWSPSSRTALADAELEYNDSHVSPSVYVKFPVSKLGSAAKSLEQFSNLHAVIWTTTPWTLPANLAIAISPSIEYCVLKWNDAHYLVAQERVDFLKQKLQSTEQTKEGEKEQTKEGEKEREKGEIVATISGSKLEMTQCVHPLFGRPSPLILSHHVTTTAGTGLVHTAPGHGEEDFAVGKKYNLPVLCPVDGSGNFTAECGDPSLVGKNVLTHGNKMIIEMLETKGMLIKHEPFTHKYPYDWRTKKPVIVRSTAQWFVDLSRVHEGAVQAIQNVTMVPPNSRLATMVVGRSSWCISRQRVWGVPIPVFYNVKTGEVLLNDESMNHILQVVRTNGTDAWWNLPVSELLPPQYRATADEWKKGEDTMDVWFDSGVSWASVLKARGIGFPADLYLEGSDQHRGWFQSSLLTSMCTNGAAPYKAIVTHGFLLDEHGQKMAKSQGNTIAPSTVITGNGNPSQAFGVDVLRMLVASSDYTKDISVGPSILRATREYLGKIRNTLRFALGNTADYVHERDAVPIHLLAPLDKYMLHKLYQVCNNISAAYETYNFSAVFRQILNFCTVELSSFYFSIIKMGLYVELPNDPRRRSAQTVLHLLIDALNKAWAPLVPHVAEDIHTHWTSADKKPASVFHSGWIKVDEAWNDPATAETFTSIIILRDEVTKLLEVMRSQKAIARQEEAEIDLYTDSQDIHNAFTSTHQIVEEVLQVAAVRLHSNANVPATEWVSTLTINVNGNPQTVKITGKVTNNAKCPRCWKHHSQQKDSPCPKCTKTLETLNIKT